MNISSNISSFSEISCSIKGIIKSSCNIINEESLLEAFILGQSLLQSNILSNTILESNIRIRIPIKIYCKMNKPLTLEDIASSVWDERRGPHRQGSSFGKLLQDLELAIKKLK